MKKNVKGAKSEKEFSREREFAVVLEKIHTDIKAIAEGQDFLRDRLDSTMGMVARNREDITMLNINVATMKDDLVKMNGKLANIEEDIRIIKTDFGRRLTHLEATQ